MLAWVAVVASLVGALFGGLGVAGVRIWFDRRQAAETREFGRSQQMERLAHEREADWRGQLLPATAAFSTGIERAILGVRDVIGAVRAKRDVELVVGDAKGRIDQAVTALAPIKLLFKEDAEAIRIAKDLVAELDLARKAATSADPTFAWEKLTKVYALHAEFTRAAFEMIAKPRWTVGAEVPVAALFPPKHGRSRGGRPPD